MQNLESVAQKLAELPLGAPETPPSDAPDQKNSHNLSGQSIQTSMQNLESVAQKMAELPLDAPETPPSDAPDQKKILIICRDCPYELPCKIWSL